MLKNSIDNKEEIISLLSSNNYQCYLILENLKFILMSIEDISKKLKFTNIEILSSLLILEHHELVKSDIKGKKVFYFKTSKGEFALDLFLDEKNISY